MPSLLLLLALAWAVNFAGRRVVPLAMPRGRLRPLALALAGAWLGSWLDGRTLELGPRVAGVNLAAAFLGAALFTLALGLSPFFKILLGRGRRLL